MGTQMHRISRIERLMVTYYFGKRFARCIKYDLVCVDDDYKIENPKVSECKENIPV